MKKLLTLLLIVYFIAFPFQNTQAAAQWVDIEINSSFVPGDLTDFPVYVDLSDLPAAFWDTTNCTDIRMFKSDGTTEVPREIVDCTDNGSSGTGELHFLADGTLSSTATSTFQLHYDGTSSDYAVGATYGRDAVWADYVAVWHDGGAGTDSTGNGHTGTTTGSPSIGGATGKVGVATDYNGTSQYVAVADAAALDPTTITVKAWINTTNTTQRGRIIDKYEFSTSPDNGYQLEYRGDTAGDYVNVDFGTATGAVGDSTRVTSATDVSGGGWFMYDMTYDGTTAILYEQGSSADTNSHSSTIDANALDLHIASQAPSPGSTLFDGLVDGIRVSSGALSSDWIETEYNNQNSPDTFYFVSDEQTGGGGFTPVQSIFWFF